MLKPKPEVLVVGAGPVGLFTALALARRDVPVRIIDTGLWPCSHSYALALHPQTVQLLAELGLAESVLAHAYPVPRLGFYDCTGLRASIPLGQDAASSGLAVLRQSFLEDLLEEALGRTGVKVSWRHELAGLDSSGGEVTATINRFKKVTRGYVVAHNEWVVDQTANLQVPFVVGADGHNSHVRRALGIHFPEVAPPQYFAVFEFKTNANLQHETRIILGERTTDVLWPLANGYARWSFELPGYDDPRGDVGEEILSGASSTSSDANRLKDRGPTPNPGDLPVLSEQSLAQLIEERAPWFDGSVEAFNWRTVVRFERRLASSFGQDRIWLAGDAAHITGPAAVQSMNMGFLEGAHLAGCLSSILRGRSSPGELSAYNSRWTQVWRELHGLDVRLVPTPKASAWIAAHANRLLPCLPAHGAALSAMAGHLGLEVQIAQAATC